MVKNSKTSKIARSVSFSVFNFLKVSIGVVCFQSIIANASNAANAIDALNSYALLSVEVSTQYSQVAQASSGGEIRARNQNGFDVTLKGLEGVDGVGATSVIYNPTTNTTIETDYWDPAERPLRPITETITTKNAQGEVVTKEERSFLRNGKIVRTIVQTVNESGEKVIRTTTYGYGRGGNGSLRRVSVYDGEIRSLAENPTARPITTVTFDRDGIARVTGDSDAFTGIVKTRPGTHMTMDDMGNIDITTHNADGTFHVIRIFLGSEGPSIKMEGRLSSGAGCPDGSLCPISLGGFNSQDEYIGYVLSRPYVLRVRDFNLSAPGNGSSSDRESHSGY